MTSLIELRDVVENLECSVSKYVENVEELARFFIDNCADNVGAYAPVYHCRYCNHKHNYDYIANIEHLPECPVWLAINLLD